MAEHLRTVQFDTIDGPNSALRLLILFIGQRVPENPIVNPIFRFSTLAKIETCGFTVPFFGSTRAALSVKSSFKTESRPREILIHKTPKTAPAGRKNNHIGLF